MTRLPDREVELLETVPAVAPLLTRSLAAGVVRKVTGRKPTGLPGRQVRVHDVTQDVARLAQYDRVCGFSVRDTVPATWLHVLTFPLQMQLLSADDSPFSLAGLVHVTNSMTLLRPVAVGEKLALAVSYGQPREHRRGVLLDLVGEAYVGDDLVWRGSSAYLARGGKLPDMLPGRGNVDLPDDFEETPADSVWRLPANLGRTYASVSGDVNPIHLNPLAAKAFGFPKAIIHGMWTHARVLAALENRLSEAYRMDVRFTKPILLPSSVRFGASVSRDGFDAVVRNRAGDKTHLTARIIRADRSR